MLIDIDSVGLSTIHAAGQAVTLIRRTDQIVVTNAVAATATVVWQAFAPLQKNTVTWADEYYCFATTTPLTVGAVIALNAVSAAPMQIGIVYRFTQGQFIRQQTQNPGSCYVVANATPNKAFAFGLAQVAVVNGVKTLAPFCATPVLYNEAAYFTPTTTIAVLLSSANAAGTLLPQPSGAFEIAVTSGNGGPTLGFNDQTNMFFQLS